MKTVGLAGGSLIVELGPHTDVQLFFECLDAFVFSKHPGQDWRLLSDRLYKRCLKLDELDEASALMREAENELQQLPSTAIDWQDYAANNPATTNSLQPAAITLEKVFERYFAAFALCVKSAKSSYEIFSKHEGYQYEPVRFIVTNVPWSTIENARPLRDYDENSGGPFWMS